MDNNMYQAASHKNDCDPQHLPISRATSYVPASQAIRMDSSMYEPVNIMNTQMDTINGAQWDLHKNANQMQTQNTQGGTYSIRQYTTPKQQLGYHQNSQQYVTDTRPSEIMKRQPLTSHDNSSHGFPPRHGTDFKTQQNFANPYILRQLKSSHDVSDRDLDSLPSENRGLVSNFARKMQTQSSELHIAYPPSSLSAVAKQMGSQGKQSSYLQTTDLQQLREQRAAFKEYEQKYFGGNHQQSTATGRNASLNPPQSIPLHNKLDQSGLAQQQIPLVNAPPQIHQSIRAANATSASPTRPSIVPPLPIGGGATASPERRPAVIFHPEEDEGDIEDSSNSIRDEERKEEDSLDEGVEANRLEQAQEAQDQEDFHSPERNRRTIQEQQTCWRQRNGSVEQGSLEPRRNDQDESSPVVLNRSNPLQRVSSNRNAGHHHQTSPDPVQIQTFFFQSPDKRGKYVDQNPESPPKIQLQDQRRIRHSTAQEQQSIQQLSVNLQNQIDRQILENNEIVSPYDMHKAALTLQQQNNTEPVQGVRKSQSLARGSSKHATRSTTINEADQFCQNNKNGQNFLESQTIIVPEVYMRCVTWTRDSNGLFDYESKNISKKNIKTQTGGRVVRIGEEVQLVSKSHKLETLAFHDADANQMIDPQRMVVIERSMGGLGNFIIRNDTCRRIEDVQAQHTNNPDHLPQNMFIVVRNTKSTLNNQDYKLCRGDTIKLGRIKFKVKAVFGGAEGEIESPGKKENSQKSLEVDSECSSEDEDQAFKTIDIDMSVMSARSKLSKQLNAQAAQEVPDTKREADKANRQCKFCWMSESTEANPLLSACQCDGSMRFIHFSCLKQWISEKMVRKEIDMGELGKIFTYTWKQFECEICKHAYPLTFKSKVNDKSLVYGIVKDLIQPDMPHVSPKGAETTEDAPSGMPYLLIQSLPFEKTSGRVVHLIVPNKAVPELPPLEQTAENADVPDQRHIRVFKMGRGHESSVRICDISVSRCHTLIKFDPIKCQFQLEDNLSKFGTLVLPKTKDIQLEPNCTKAVQIGRSVISFTVKEVEKIIQPKTISQSPKRYTQDTTSKDLETMVKDTQTNSVGLQKVKSTGISEYQDGQQATQIQEQIENAQYIVEKNPEVSPFLDNEQQQIELLLKQKIHETNQKIEKLMKCESKYIEQLKQSMNDPSHQDEERIEEALIKAANSLIQAKFQLEELDNKTKSTAQQHQQSKQKESVEQTPQMQIEDQNSRSLNAQRSLTTEKKSHTPSQTNQQSKTEHKPRSKITSAFSNSKNDHQLERNSSIHDRKKDLHHHKSTNKQIDEIIQKFSPERSSKTTLHKQQHQRLSAHFNDGIAPYHKIEIKKQAHLSHSKTSLKKENKNSGDQSMKKITRDHGAIIEDYRVPCQVSKKNAAKSPSPKRVKVGRNTSPFIVSSQKPIKSSKVTKTVSKHYHDTHMFSDQKGHQNSRYLNNQSPLNKSEFRPFNPVDDRSPERTGQQMLHVSTTDQRQSNPFRIDSYELGAGNNAIQYSGLKMNNYLSGAGSQGSYLNEFNDAHYRQSLTNSKMTTSIPGGRGGPSTNLGSAMYSDLYDHKQGKHTSSTQYHHPSQQSSYAAHHQSYAAPSSYANSNGQSRFYNNYIGNGLVGTSSSGAGNIVDPSSSSLAGQHRINNNLATGTRYSQQYGPAGSANLANSYKLTQPGYAAATQSRYGGQGYKRGYY